MFVKPGVDTERPGKLLRVRVPRTHELIPDEGMDVPETSFWHWMLNHGDVVRADPPAAAEADASPAAIDPVQAEAQLADPAHERPAGEG
jgi:hypothetical protein